MDFDYNEKTLEHKEKLESFMEDNVYPAEQEHHSFVEDPSNMWQQPPIVEELKSKAQAAKIWNWFLPAEYAEWSPGFFASRFEDKWHFKWYGWHPKRMHTGRIAG